MDCTSKHYINKTRAVDPLNPLAPLHVGLFERFVYAGTEKRRVLIYIPEGIRPSCAGIFVLGPDGKTADDMLQESGWRALADQDGSREKFAVFFLEPGSGGWDTKETYGAGNGDVAYVEAVYALGCERKLLCVHEAKMYLAGYAEGGIIANMAVMYQPAVWAGICSVCGSSVEEDYMRAASSDICVNLNGFEDPEGVLHIHKGNVAVPAWIIDSPDKTGEKENQLCSYWKHACGITEDGIAGQTDTVQYERRSLPPYPENQEKEAFCVWHTKLKETEEGTEEEWTERISDFLLSHRKWMGDPGGDLRTVKDPIRHLGMQYCAEVIDGWLREWFVYIPERLRDRNDEKVPLVLAMHGYSCTGDLYAGNTEWPAIADRFGFIVVFPTATPGNLDMQTRVTSSDNMKLPAWNLMHSEKDGPDENLFFEILLDRLYTEYPVDKERIYATGHSYGSLMTQILGMTKSEHFTAVAPCSGVIFPFDALDIRRLPEVRDRADGQEVPVWMFVGEKESWLIPHLPAPDNISGKTIQIWKRINHLSSEKEDRYQTGWNHNGIWNDLQFQGDSGIPMVKYTWVDNMPHAVTPEICRRIWESFFSKLNKKDGIIHYTDGN